MPKEIVVNAWCDPCYAEGEHSPGDEVTIAVADLARMKPRTLLLCERHRKEVYDPLREFLVVYGVATDTDAPTPSPAKRRATSTRTRSDYGPYPEGEWVCPHPECDRSDLKDKEKLQRHMRADHEITLGDFLAQHGGVVEPTPPRATPDMPLRSIPETGIKMFCPFEDCKFNRAGGSPSKNKRALAQHFSQRHGVPMGQWFRDHPEVDPESLCVREADEDTLV